MHDEYIHVASKGGRDGREAQGEDAETRRRRPPLPRGLRPDPVRPALPHRRRRPRLRVRRGAPHAPRPAHGAAAARAVGAAGRLRPPGRVARRRGGARARGEGGAAGPVPRAALHVRRSRARPAHARRHRRLLRARRLRALHGGRPAGDRRRGRPDLRAVGGRDRRRGRGGGPGRRRPPARVRSRRDPRDGREAAARKARLGADRVPAPPRDVHAPRPAARARDRPRSPAEQGLVPAPHARLGAARGDRHEPEGRRPPARGALPLRAAVGGVAAGCGRGEEAVMAEITRLGVARHLRSDASAHVLMWKAGRLVRAGRGLAFLFQPHSASIAEVPVDDREMPVVFHGRSSDFQDVTAQGVLTFRVTDPAVLATRVDFTIDLASGAWRRQPLETLALLFAQLAEQHAAGWVARTPVRSVLAVGTDRIRAAIEAGLAADPALPAMGRAVVSVRVSSVRPTPELEKALEAPTRESIQQAADEATFARRALAVEKERAIQENELKNRIELARREEELIGQQGQNGRRQAAEEAEAQRIAAEAKAARTAIEAAAAAARVRAAGEAEAHRTRLQGEAEASALELSEKIRSASERARMEAVREVPPAVMFAVAAREIAGKLEKIERVRLGGGTLAPALEKLLEAGARRLAEE